MIDTIVLKIKDDDFLIRNHVRFNPSTEFLYKPIHFNSKGEQKFICNPTKKEKSQYYFPRISVHKRFFGIGFEVSMKVEFSAPKLLFQNNFQEAQDSNFEELLTILLNRMVEMEIFIHPDVLRKAYVQKIDYSKNIFLENYTTCSMVISELAKLNLTKRLDLTKTDYKNEGQAIAYHSSSYEVKIYDKVKDLEQGKKFGEKRSFEKDNQCQKDLFNWKKEVLRLEVRLSRRKLTPLFKKLELDTELIFCNIFQKGISKTILLFFWKQIALDLQFVHFDPNKIDNLFASIKASFTNSKGSKHMQILGAIILINKIGVRAARIELNLPNHSWYRLLKDLKQVSINEKNYRFLSILELESKLEKFETITSLEIN